MNKKKIFATSLNLIPLQKRQKLPGWNNNCEVVDECEVEVLVSLRE